MLTLLTLVLLVFVLSGFFNDSTLVLVGVVLAVVSVTMINLYDCQVVTASGVGVCKDASQNISEVNRSASYVLGLWLFAYPVRGAIRSFIPRLQ